MNNFQAKRKRIYEHIASIEISPLLTHSIFTEGIPKSQK